MDMTAPSKPKNWNLALNVLKCPSFADGHTELKKNALFVVPGLVRMVVVKKPATKERKGINPFTGLETVFKAKPARKVVKARAVKAAKDAVA